MKLSVSQLARLADISVRTLRYYDEIGLLKPTKITAAGYRYYDEEAFSLLQQILFYRELEFSLKDIKDLLHQPDYDHKQTLQQHLTILYAKKQRMEHLILLVEQTIKGERTMETNQIEHMRLADLKQTYTKEVEERWGKTPAYEESKKKTAAYNKEDLDRVEKISNTLLQQFAALRHKSPTEQAVQDLVAHWQQHITIYFYQCNNEILASLGQLYCSDPRFQKNLDRLGEGTATFMSEAIKIYCKRNNG